MISNKDIYQRFSKKKKKRKILESENIKSHFFLDIIISFTYPFPFLFRYCALNSVHFSPIPPPFPPLCCPLVGYEIPLLNPANFGLHRVNFPMKFRGSAFFRMKFPHKAIR